MNSVSHRFLIAITVVGAWMMLFFGGGHSQNATSQELINTLRKANGGSKELYLQKFLIGNETSYAGSFIHIHTYDDCVKELVMEYDDQRFPQYVIQSSCRIDDNCTSVPQDLTVLKLNYTKIGFECRHNLGNFPKFLEQLFRMHL